jgi:hypothetical protein
MPGGHCSFRKMRMASAFVLDKLVVFAMQCS